MLAKAGIILASGFRRNDGINVGTGDDESPLSILGEGVGGEDS